MNTEHSKILSKLLAVIIASAFVGAIVYAIIFELKKRKTLAQDSTTTSSPSVSLAQSAKIQNVSISNLDTAGKQQSISQNADSTNNLAILKKTLISDNFQIWQIVPSVKIGSVVGTQLQNAQSKGFLAVDGGLGKIVIVPSSTISTSTLWNLPTTVSGIISPADPIYGPPSESVQLVLDQYITDTSVQAEIQSAVKPSASQQALNNDAGLTDSSNTNVTCTLTKLNSTATQMWTLKYL